jgi:hypothetical protein
MVRAIETHAPASGVYQLPRWDLGGEGLTREQKRARGEALVARMKRGPMVIAAVDRRGAAEMGTYLLRGFAVDALVCGILAWLVARAGVVGLLDRALFVALAGGAGALGVRGSEWNWHGFATRYTLVHVVDAFVGWFLAGSGIAAVLP